MNYTTTPSSYRILPLPDPLTGRIDIADAVRGQLDLDLEDEVDFFMCDSMTRHLSETQS
jgi:hypothetical protein